MSHKSRNAILPFLVAFLTIFSGAILTAEGALASPPDTVTARSDGTSLKLRYLPPHLVVTVKFTDPSGNNIIDAEERCTFIVRLENKGLGKARDVEVGCNLTEKNRNISISDKVIIGDIAAGTSKECKIFAVASEYLASGKSTFHFKVDEAMGYPPKPVNVTVETAALKPPKLNLAAVGIDDNADAARGIFGNNDGAWNKGETVEITIAVKNSGVGSARGVRVIPRVKSNDIDYFGRIGGYEIGDLSPGSYKMVKFSCAVKMTYRGKGTDENGLPIFVDILEERDRFSKKNVPLGLRLQKVQSASEIVVEGREEKAAPVVSEAPVTIGSDVDRPPKTKMKNPDAVAVVIGISKYKYKDVPRAKYSRRDARAVRDYLINALGYNPHNVIYLPDEKADLSSLRSNIKRKLKRLVVPGKSDLFFYYSGHGVPSYEGGNSRAYILSYTGQVDFPEDGGYALDELYRDLRNTGARDIVAVLDACFSGGYSEGTLVDAKGPVIMIKNKAKILADEGVVFTSCESNEVSFWDDDHKHGLFTYYFLKGLRGDADANGDNRVSAEELEEYLKPRVSKRAMRIKGRPQTPMCLGMKKDLVLIKLEK